MADDRILIDATNATFWQITGYKPGQRLDMSDPKDREMSKTWRDIYAQIRGHRDRAMSIAQKTLHETLIPYLLVIEGRDGSLSAQAFENRGNLDVQYRWMLEQPDQYTYLSAVDFTQKRDAPVLDQFAITKRQQAATSGWY